MQVPAYNQPRLREYSASFVQSTLRQRHQLEARIFRRRYFSGDMHDEWVTYQHQSDTPDPDWQLKLYICVRAKYYWSTVRRLVDNSDTLRTDWKFYMAPRGYERPDKIVLYPNSIAELQRVIEILERTLPRVQGHLLHHVCEPGEFGLRTRLSRVFYVGCDPEFLEQSWRFYRCITAAWASINREYLDSLPGGFEHWLRSMNLSPVHEGPAALEPNVDPEEIRRNWAIINDTQ